MQEPFIKPFRAALMAKIQACEETALSLTQEGRTDEASHQKAAGNIYGIYAGLLDTIPSAPAYERLFDTIPQNWLRARELAESHGDFTRVAMEDVKLSALMEIKTLYASFKGGDTHGR